MSFRVEDIHPSCPENRFFRQETHLCKHHIPPVPSNLLSSMFDKTINLLSFSVSAGHSGTLLMALASSKNNFLDYLSRAHEPVDHATQTYRSSVNIPQCTCMYNLVQNTTLRTIRKIMLTSSKLKKVGIVQFSNVRHQTIPTLFSLVSQKLKNEELMMQYNNY